MNERPWPADKVERWPIIEKCSISSFLEAQRAPALTPMPATCHRLAWDRAMTEHDLTPHEEWRAIPGYDGYEASSLGRIRSLPRPISIRLPCGVTYDRMIFGRVLRQNKMPNGYFQVSLGKDTKCYVHRAIALAFLGEPSPDRPEAAHRDGNKSNNKACNLIWSSRSENEQQKRQHGTYFTRVGLKGVRHHKAKLTDADIIDIRSAWTGERGLLTRLALRYKVDRSTIARIVSGTGWTHV